MNDPVPPAPMEPTETAPSPGAVRGYDELRRTVIGLIRSAKRDVRIFAPWLDPLVFNSASVTDTLMSFAVKHARNQVRILVENSQQMLRDNGRLIMGARRLAGGIDLREIEESDRGARDLYLCADRAAALVQETVDETRAVITQTPAQTAALTQRFDAAWERAQPIALRTLGL